MECVSKVSSKSRELQRVEVELQQAAVDHGGAVGKVLRDGRGRVLQCRCERPWRLVEDGVGLGHTLDQPRPASLQAVQRLLQRGGAAARTERNCADRRLALYMARARSTRLWASSTSTPTRHAFASVKPCSIAAAVEEVVVVADDDVAPSRHFLAEVVRAHRMREGDLAQRLAGQRCRPTRPPRELPAGGRRSPGRADTNRRGRPCRDARRTSRGRPVRSPAAASRDRFGGWSAAHSTPAIGRSLWPSGRMTLSSS